MNELNRRDVIRGVAAGGLLAGGAAVRLPDRSERLQQWRREGARRAVAVVLPGGGNGLSPVIEARVAMCRSWDGQVHLELADGRCGFVALEPRGFMLAAAAQAAGRAVAVRCWGHEAAAEGGLGRFAGALLAIDASDLGAPEVQS